MTGFFTSGFPGRTGNNESFQSLFQRFRKIFRYKILGMGIGNFVVIIINYSYYGEAEFFFCLRVFIGGNPENLKMVRCNWGVGVNL